MGSSEEPTSPTAGHAATAAPTGPCSRPCAMVAASVAAKPRPRSHRADAGTGSLRRAESSITIELALINPSTVSGTRRPRPTGPTVCPHQGVGVLVRRHPSDRRNPDHHACGRPPDHMLRGGHSAPPKSASENSAVSNHGLFDAVPRPKEPPAAPEDPPSATRLTSALPTLSQGMDRAIAPVSLCRTTILARSRLHLRTVDWAAAERRRVD
jgi:hypothetical protein